MLDIKVLRTAQFLARHLPLPIASPLVRAATHGYARFSPDERVMVERNLRRVHGSSIDDDEIDAMVAEVFENYGRYWLDSLRLSRLSPEQIDDGFSYEGLHHLFEPLDAGVVPIVAMPHLGGWEWAAAWLTKVHRWPVASVAERLEPPEVYEWFLQFRRELGMEIVALGPSAGAEIANKLAGGSIISLLADRDISGDGIEVEFFGERTRIPGGPAVLALRSGAPLIPAAAFFEDRHCHAVVLPPIDTERRGKLRADLTPVTQDLATALEVLIRRAPEQWHLLQPNWPSDYDALGRERPAWFRDT